MKLIGQVLRSRRESLGMTLLDLEKKIKIQRKYIEMIERNEFDHLPNPDYTRGFINKYAQAVNMNGDELINQHIEELPTTKLSAKEASAHIKHVKTESSKDNSARKLLAWLLGIILTLFLIWLIFSNFILTDRNSEWQAEDINKSRNVAVEKKTEEKPATAKQDSNSSKTQAKQKSKTEEPLKLTYKNFDGANLAYEIESKEQLEVKIDSKTPTWVQVLDDKKKNYAYKEMTKETMKIDKDAKSITLISGNSTVMDVYINGKKVTVPTEAENLITRTYFFKVVK